MTDHDRRAHRADAYLAKLEPTQCGTSTCHNRTYAAAIFLIVTANLDRATAESMLRQWIARGNHAFTDREINHKLNQAEAYALSNPAEVGHTKKGEPFAPPPPNADAPKPKGPLPNRANDIRPRPRFGADKPPSTRLGRPAAVSRFGKFNLPSFEAPPDPLAPAEPLPKPQAPQPPPPTEPEPPRAEPVKAQQTQPSQIESIYGGKKKIWMQMKALKAKRDRPEGGFDRYGERYPNIFEVDPRIIDEMPDVLLGLAVLPGKRDASVKLAIDYGIKVTGETWEYVSREGWDGEE